MYIIINDDKLFKNASLLRIINAQSLFKTITFLIIK